MNNNYSFAKAFLGFMIMTLASITVFSQSWVVNYPPTSHAGFDTYSVPKIEKTSDGGQLLHGIFSSDFGPFILDLYFIKTDQQGNQQWFNRLFYDYQLQKQIHSYDLISTPDGYLLPMSRWTSVDNINEASIELTKIMSNGQQDWVKTIDITENPPDSYDFYQYNVNIHSLSDGNFLITALLQEKNCNGSCEGTYVMIKVDNSGEVIWKKTQPMSYFSQYTIFYYQDALDNFDNPVVAILNSNQELDIHTFNNDGDYQSTQNIFAETLSLVNITELKFSSENHLMLGLGIKDAPNNQNVSQYVYKIDLPNNQIIWEYGENANDPFPPIHDFCIFPDDQIAILYDDFDLDNYRYRKIVLVSSDGTIDEDNILENYSNSFTLLGNNGNMVSAQYIECCEDGSILLTGTQLIYSPQSFTTYINALMKIGADQQIFTSTVCGTLYIDENQNCIQDGTEIGIPDQVVYLPNSFYYAITDSLGDYCFILNEGTYETSSSLTDYGLWKTACPDSTFSFTIGENDTILNNDLAYYSDLYCPLMTVSFGANRLRRCFPNNFYVEYCNVGTAPTDTAFIEIEFGEYIIVDSASIAYQQIGNDTYLFNLNELIDINDCGSFIVHTTVDCEAPLESTTCAEANIFPNDYCGDTNDLWDMSNIEVSAECVGDSIEFRILNTGQSMVNARHYDIYEDNLLRQAGNFQLGGMQDTTIKVASGPYTFRMTAEQSPFHPEDSNPQAFIEGCEGVNIAGVILTVPQDDRMLHKDIDCHQIIGSFDPNDKLVSPAGVGDEHFTTPDDELEYTIRFQNVGNDTAFNIYILDTISQHLDMSTFVSGAASHDYNVQILQGNIIRWDFPNILLVDSVRNEPASHGFVKFNIKQKPNNPDGTRIENIAGIYFDFNAPIITPLVFNTIKRPPFYEDFCEDFTSIIEVMCDEIKSNFDIILSLNGGYPGTNGYNIVDNLTNEVYLNITDNIFILGPYPTGSYIDLSVSVADHPECSRNVATIVDCVTTHIELLDFNGKAMENVNELQWTVATEREIKSYELQRSSDGINFETIFQTTAKGNSNTINTYDFMDENFTKTVNFYRLNHTDYSGRTQSSKIISLDNRKADYDVKIYPNPANELLTLTFNSNTNKDKTIQLINKEGKEISTRKFKALARENNIQFNIENLPSGIYFIRITDEIENKFIKFIKN